VPVVAAAVSSGTRRAYGSYWNRVVRAWGDRRIDESRPSEIEQHGAQVQANVVARRNARGRRSAAEHMVAVALRRTMAAIAAFKIDLKPRVLSRTGH
jgi:integrase/recombinase XerC